MAVFELRRYRTRPGRRDDLIALFEREFIETQEACGMVPLGHYRDLDDPDSFVWFRVFADMENRRRALEAFYLESPAWLNNRDAANATIDDSDNVLLLKPAVATSGFDLRGLVRPSGLETDARDSLVGAAIFSLDTPASPEFIAQFERDVLPQLERHAGRLAYFVTETRANDFPRLPVREDESALVVVGVCASAGDLDAWTRCLGTARESLRLQPASRALFR